MKRILAPTLALAAALALTAATAQAADIFGGLYRHDVNIGIAKCCFESGEDIEIGARTGPLALLSRLGDFSLYGLGSVNTSGGVDFAAAGLAWRIPLGHRFYFRPALGGAVQSGSAAKVQETPDKLYLGSRLLFEPEAALGVQLSPRWAAEASYVHLSHGQLAGRQNPGLDDLGLRLAYSFGG
jgi:lipid A 3-O-deacylase